MTVVAGSDGWAAPEPPPDPAMPLRPARVEGPLSVARPNSGPVSVVVVAALLGLREALEPPVDREDPVHEIERDEPHSGWFHLELTEDPRAARATLRWRADELN